MSFKVLASGSGTRRPWALSRDRIWHQAVGTSESIDQISRRGLVTDLCAAAEPRLAAPWDLDKVTR